MHNISSFPYSSLSSKIFWKNIAPDTYLVQCRPNEKGGILTVLVNVYGNNSYRFRAFLTLEEHTSLLDDFTGNFLTLYQRMHDIVMGAIVLFDSSYRIEHEADPSCIEEFLK